MFESALQNRLEELTRRQAAGASALATTSPAVTMPVATASVATAPERDSTCLTDLIPGGTVAGRCGEYYEISAPVRELWPAGEPIRRQARAQESRTQPASAVAVQLALAIERGICLLDLETCGFAGSPIFLIGLLHQVDGQYVLHQLLARNYAEERAVLAALADRLGSETALATFNGKSFDWPLVVERSHRHRLELPFVRPREHFDLLHVARRRWRRLLPDCKLQTLERFICRRTRGADVPGAQIPQEYHYFVRTGDARRLAEIVRHNQLDLLTLWELVLRLVAAG